jgi:hypothetical protein
MKNFIDSILINRELNEFFVPTDSTVTAENNWKNPDIRPNKFDQNFDNWIARLATWGQIQYSFISKEGKKETLEASSFFAKLNVNNFSELYSQFNIEIRNIYEVDFIRKLASVDGKPYDEIFKIYIKLKPELKKGLTLWTKLFN